MKLIKKIIDWIKLQKNKKEVEKKETERIIKLIEKGETIYPTL